jgi:transcription antitermination factor NusG
MDARWYCVVTNPRCELRAAASVEARGIGPYLPMLDRVARRGTRMVDVRLPLFPRYLFIAVVRDGQFYDLRSCDGVYGVLRNDGRPVEVPLRIIAELQSAEAQGVFDWRPKNATAFAPGSPVRLIGWPGGTIVAEIIRQTSTRRVDVLLRMLGAERRVSVPIDQVEAIAE